jgi:hypothetical protein
MSNFDTRVDRPDTSWVHAPFIVLKAFRAYDATREHTRQKPQPRCCQRSLKAYLLRAGAAHIKRVFHGHRCTWVPFHNSRINFGIVE